MFSWLLSFDFSQYVNVFGFRPRAIMARGLGRCHVITLSLSLLHGNVENEVNSSVFSLSVSYSGIFDNNGLTQ